MITASNLLQRVPTLFTDLAKILSGEIDCSHITLTKYSKDNSPYTITPQAIIFPKTATDIKHVLSFAREYKMPVTVRGSGKGDMGGCLGEGIILDMTRYFSMVRNVNMMENTVTVDAGVTIEVLLEKLHAWNFDIPLLSKNEPETTVGALIATKSGTTSSFRHGTLREWIEGVTVVVDNGEEHRIFDGITPSGRLLGIYQEVFPLLTKEGGALRANKPSSHDDATGYNLWSTSIGPRQLLDQLTGSEGTLGIITSVTFRTTPHKEHVSTSCVPVTDKKLLTSCIEIAKHHKAEKIFLYDETFMQLAKRYYPNLVPFFLETPYVLLVTHTDTDKERLTHTVRTFTRALPVEDYTIKTITDISILNRITSSDFLTSLFEQYTNKTLTPILSGNGLIVTIPQIPSFLEQLEEYMNSSGKLYTVTGNVGSGNISLTTLLDPRGRLYADEILSYTKDIFSLVKKHKGGISSVSGEGIMRAPFLSYVYNDQTLLIFKKIKDVWDPLAILNPGKKIGTSTSYLNQHLTQPRREE